MRRKVVALAFWEQGVDEYLVNQDSNKVEVFIKYTKQQRCELLSNRGIGRGVQRVWMNPPFKPTKCFLV